MWIPYHQAEKMSMLFDVFYQSSVPTKMYATPYTNRMCTVISDEINQSFTLDHKDMFIFHQRYGHTIKQWWQSLLREHKYNTKNRKIIIETSVIKNKNPAAHICKMSLCVAWQMSKMKNSGVNYHKKYIDEEVIGYWTATRWVQKPPPQ